MGITFNFGQSESSKKESGNESVDLEAIKKNLLNVEVSKSSEISNTLPDIYVDTSVTIFLRLRRRSQLCYLHKIKRY